MSLIAHYMLDNQCGVGANLFRNSIRPASASAASGIVATVLDTELKVVVNDRSNNYVSIGSFGSSDDIYTKIGEGNYFSLSCDCMYESDSSGELPYMFFSGATGMNYAALNSIIPTSANRWFRIYQTRILGAPGGSYGNISLHFGFAYRNCSGTYHFKNFKLEKVDGSSSKPSAWLPHITDADYIYPYNLEANILGNKNYNGTKTSGCTLDYDSPKGLTSTKFDGTSSYIQLANQIQISFDTGCTLSVWVKLLDTTGTKYIISHHSGGPVNSALGISGNKLLTYHYNGTWLSHTSTNTLTTNVWYHVAYVMRNGQCTFYINGIKDSIVDSTISGSGMSVPWDVIGSRWGYGEKFKGSMFDLCIYDYALTTEQITNLYNKGDGYILPSGYKRLEYIESTGTQYIKTNIKNIKFDDDITVKFLSKHGSSTDLAIIGGRNSASSGMSLWDFDYAQFFNASDRPLLGHTVTPNVVHTFFMNKYAVYLDGTKYEWLSGNKPSATGGSTASLFIFATGNGETVDSRMLVGRIMEVRISNTCYFIPAKRTSDNVLGMYDVANNIFYTNNGSGTFIAGPEVN